MINFSKAAFRLIEFMIQELKTMKHIKIIEKKSNGAKNLKPPSHYQCMAKVKKNKDEKQLITTENLH